MWPFSSKFLRAMRRTASTVSVRSRGELRADDTFVFRTETDAAGFHITTKPELGKLVALISGQAEIDGASRVQLFYGKNRILYTIDGTDYDMIPVPPPANVDLVRALASESGTAYGRSGSLSIAFADCTVKLTVTHHPDVDDPYFEITGFTGEPAAGCMLPRDCGVAQTESESHGVTRLS